MRFFVTGARGFIGRHATRAIAARGHVVAVDGGLEGVDAVLHLANIAHAAVGKERLREVNVEQTERLAQAAAKAGVRRFLYVSSVKVHGEHTDATPFTESSALCPQDIYGRTKLEAERALRAIAGLDVVVLRPPLVYGPGVKSNFLNLMGAVAEGWPLPLASIDNRRSFLYVGNLCDAIVQCLEHAHAARQTYVVSDGLPISTPDLCREIGIALGRRARLFRCPVSMLRILPGLRKLTSSLVLDDRAIRMELNWRPQFSLSQGLGATARWYRDR